MTPETDPKKITAILCEFARANFVAEGVEFDEQSPLSQAGIDSFALVELVLFCERVLGVRVPDSHLTGTNLASMSALAKCIAGAGTEWPAIVLKFPAATMSDLPRQIRLAAGDYFMHGQDCRMRQAGLPGNVCCAVIKLGNGFDMERLRRRIAESPSWTGWRVRGSSVRCRCCVPRSGVRRQSPKEILFEHNAENGGAELPWSLPQVVADREVAREPRARIGI